MRIEEAFVVNAPRERVWGFFDHEVERVARCMPGVEAVQPLGEARYRVRMTQRLGFLTATFDLVLQVEHTEPPRLLEFSGAGRAVRGARGEVRGRNWVELTEEDGGRTRVAVRAEMTMGGMLGMLGPRFVEARVREMNTQFARALSAEIRRWAAAR